MVVTVGQAMAMDTALAMTTLSTDHHLPKDVDRSGSTHVILHNDMDHLKGSFKGCEEPPRVPGPHFENYYVS